MELRSLRYFVAVAEEKHFGRAAARLYMTQPPLSRAIKELEAELGCLLFSRAPDGVRLTPAGQVLLDEARTLLRRAERARAKVVAAGEARTFVVGTLAGAAEGLGPRLVAEYRREHPLPRVDLREADLTDPTVGLRAGLVDVALTRLPFDDTGIATRVLRVDPVVAVLPADDPLAGKSSLSLADLGNRMWFRLPDDSDPLWREYWLGMAPPRSEGPVVRTATECLQAVLWNGAVGLMPAAHPLPDGLAAVSLVDMPPSRLVVAWSRGSTDPLVAAFVRIAVAVSAVDGQLAQEFS